MPQPFYHRLWIFAGPAKLYVTLYLLLDSFQVLDLEWMY